LSLKCDTLVSRSISKFAFRCNLYRYVEGLCLQIQLQRMAGGIAGFLGKALEPPKVGVLLHSSQLIHSA
jgi:hypothetical protein